MEKMTEEQKTFLENYLNGKPKSKAKNGFWNKIRLYFEWAAKNYLRSQIMRSRSF